MRRSSKANSRRRTSQPQRTDVGTIKSIERQRGTGSIAPDRESRVNADTGFTSAEVVQEDFDNLELGDRVHFDATPDPDRPGYAKATAVQPQKPASANDNPQRDRANTIAAQQHSPPPEEDEMSAADQAVKNQEQQLASGEENPG
jgi:cold shock CspA family protein